MGLPVFEVTGRDFEALVPILRTRAIKKFPNLPQTSFNVSDFTQMFIDMFAGVGDGLNFYIDNVAKELFWPTVRRRESASRLGALIGYRLPSAKAATVSVRLSIPTPVAGNVTIPARTQVQTNDPDDPVVFETISDAVIAAGSLFIDTLVENAQLYTQEFTSDGSADQSFTVDESPFVEGSQIIVVGLDEWTQVDDFFNSKSIDKHYLLQVDKNDVLTIVFGNGETGAIPIGTISVTYKTGGGVRGNVFADTIKVLEASFTDEFSTPVTVSVTNPEPAQNGADRQSVNQARLAAPRTTKTNQRTVAREDFELNAQDVAGVSRARVFTSNEDILIPENTGFLYIVPIGGGTPSTQLRQEVFDYLTNVKPMTLGFVLNVVSPTFVPISFTMKVFVTDASFKSAAATALRASFDEFFSETVLTGELKDTPNFEMDFAKKFFNSVVEARAQSAHEKIRNVELVTDMETTYNLLSAQFPIKGALVFQDGDTGLPLE